MRIYVCDLSGAQCIACYLSAMCTSMCDVYVYM